MILWVDILGFLALCAGARFATSPMLKVLCRIAAIYVSAFTVCYYLWLLSRYHYFHHHPDVFRSGIAVAFGFEGFWALLANIVLLQGLFPAVIVITLCLAVKWLSGGLIEKIRS